MVCCQTRESKERREREEQKRRAEERRVVASCVERQVNLASRSTGVTRSSQLSSWGTVYRLRDCSARRHDAGFRFVSVLSFVGLS